MNWFWNFNVGLKFILHQGLSGTEIYGDLVCKFRRIVSRTDFSGLFRGVVVRHRLVGCGLLVSNFKVRLKFLLHQGMSGTEIYGDLVCEFRGFSVGLIFLVCFEGWWCVTDVLVVILLMSCDGLRAWWLVQLRLVALLHSLVASGGSVSDSMMVPT